MTRRTLCWAAAAFLALVTIGAPAGRPQPAGNAPRGPEVTAPPPLAPPTNIPGVDVPVGRVTVPAVPRPETVDDLLAKLEAVQRQKAQLEQQEQALKAKLQERLKDQADRMSKLGVTTPAAEKKW
jgi:hypothetical protein